MSASERTNVPLLREEQDELVRFEQRQLKIKHFQRRIQRLKKWRDRLDFTGLIANVTQIGAGIIAFFNGAPSQGTRYLTVPDLISHYGKSVNSALRSVGQTFAFVGYAASGTRALWDLGVTGYRWALNRKAKKMGHIPPDLSLLNKRKLIGRTAANIIIATFNIIAVITVIGLFTTGVGLALAATASAIGWVKDYWIPWRQTRKELTEVRQELRSLDTQIAKESLSENHVKMNKLTLQRRQTEDQLQRLQYESESYRNGMILGAISVVAFALFATGPFGLATLSMIGSIALVSCTLIGVGRMIYQSCRKQPIRVDQHAEPVEAESEIEFRQITKLNRWMSSTYNMLKGQFSDKKVKRDKQIELEEKPERQRTTSLPSRIDTPSALNEPLLSSSLPQSYRPIP
ncbi:MAG: hypothetical protein ACYCQI_05505 [Gammaproteobacteria bacterium]